MATRDEVHRLVDVLPEDRVAAIGAVLRAAVEAGLTDDQAHRLAERLRAQPDTTRLAAEPVRTFASAGTLSAEPDLAERVEEILHPPQRPWAVNSTPPTFPLPVIHGEVG